MIISVRFARADDYLDAHDKQDNSSLRLNERLFQSDERSAGIDPYFRRVIAITAGKTVGACAIRSNWDCVVQPGRLWVTTSLAPVWRGRGIDTQMLQYAIAELGPEIGGLATCVREDHLQHADFLEEFGPDALRYYIAVAGPENHDTDFTWDEFVRRINFELANEWGNLVNRSISMAHKNNGAIPEHAELTPDDQELLAAARGAFEVVGDQLGAGHFKAGITEVMRIVGLANKYFSDQEPWKLKDNPARRDTVLHVALQVVSDCNTMFTPFMPHASQKIFEALGGEGTWAAMPELVEVSEGDFDYPILQGDYASELANWESRPITMGTPLAKPTPIFSKLDEKLGETGPSWAPIVTD